MRTGSTSVRVVPSPGGGWDIHEPGRLRALGHERNKDEAVIQARALMMNGGIIKVLDRDGFIEEHHAVPSSVTRLWWQLPPSPLFWVMGSLLALQGLLNIAASPHVGSIRFWIGTITGTLGVLYLASMIASRRRRRRQIPTPD